MAFEANKVSDIKKSMEKEGRKIQMLFTKNRTVLPCVSLSQPAF
jgi:hypothetical protein